MNHYAKILEKKNANTFFKPHTPEGDAKILDALKPIVERLAKQGMSPADIARKLEQEPRVTPILARQAVQWYFY